MEKRVCATCGLPRAKSSFACHYDSHTEICHACKDFCIHRVKLAHAKSVTVHELFAAEADAARLRRYEALSQAGVVWEQVARRQHSTRKRATKRRRSTSSASSLSSSSSDSEDTDCSMPKPSAAKRRRAVAAAASSPASHLSTRRRPRLTAVTHTTSYSQLAAATAAAPTAPEQTTHCLLVDDAASVTSDSMASAVTRSPEPDTIVCPADVFPPLATPPRKALPSTTVDVTGAITPWHFFGDFDEAVDALVGPHDINASSNVDELASVMAQLDAHSPPLFVDTTDVSLDERLLALDSNMLLDSLTTTYGWDAAPVASPHALTVCM